VNSKISDYGVMGSDAIALSQSSTDISEKPATSVFSTEESAGQIIHDIGKRRLEPGL
jgi:hypothetical protein